MCLTEKIKYDMINIIVGGLFMKKKYNAMEIAQWFLWYNSYQKKCT